MTGVVGAARRGVRCALRPLRRRRGFTLLEVAFAIITVVSLTAITVPYIMSANSTATGSAAKEALTTIIVRAGGEAVADGGKYTTAGLRRAAIGVEVRAVTFAFDCGMDVGENPPAGVYSQTCPAITLGGAAAAGANLGAGQPGKLVGHVTADGRTVALSAMAVDGRCVVGVAVGETVSYVTMTDPVDGACRIPVADIP